MSVLAVYSFEDVNALLIGPGGSANLGNGSGSADEGITIEDSEERDRMTNGADGSVMHTLIAIQSARARVRLLKTSPMNAVLMSMFNYQKTSSLFWGQNTFTVSNPVSGDQHIGSSVAFVRRPENTYDKDGRMVEWELNIGILNSTLGSGVAGNLAAALAAGL